MKIKLCLLLCSLTSFAVWADANQLLSEQSDVGNQMEANYKNTEVNHSFIPSSDFEGKHSIEKDYQKVKNNSYSLPDQEEKPLSQNTNLGEKVHDTGITTLGSMDDKTEYIEANYREINQRLGNKAQRSYKFGYLFSDNVKYTSANNNFDKTFNDGPGKIHTGLVQIGYEGYINRRLVDFFWELNGGVSFRRGQGTFSSDGAHTEDAYISLWSVPVDAGLGFNMPLSPWFGVSLAGGPSAMALFQNRSDRTHDEKGKTSNQVSYGYFADAQFRFSLSDIWPGGTFELYSDYSVTKLWVNLEARMHNYANFQQKDVKVDGTLFGVSFTFELL